MLGPLVAVALLISCWAWPTVAGAANLVVNSLNENATAGDNLCTLREAIVAANGDADFHDCVASGPYGDDTITFSLSGTITLGSALPPITDADGLTIDGVGRAVILSGNDLVRPLTVNNGAALTLKNLTITRGAGADCWGFSCGGASSTPWAAP